MADLRAEGLMLSEFERIRSDQPLAEAIAALVRVQDDEDRPNVLAVVDRHSKFEGLLTSRLLCSSLLAMWNPTKSVLEDDPRLQRELIELVADRVELRIHDALPRGLPTVAPDARLLELIDAACEHQMEYLPVVVDGQVTGVVPVASLFAATAALVLRPEDEGVQF